MTLKKYEYFAHFQVLISDFNIIVFGRVALRKLVDVDPEPLDLLSDLDEAGH